MQQRAIYPGTFDPLTKGHLDIILRASHIFDELIVAIASSQSKNPMFTLEQRIEMAHAVTHTLPNVKVQGFEGLLVDLSDTLQSNIIIRGIRSVTDFEYELQMGYANTSLKQELETLYLMPKLEHTFISSSLVRSLIPFEGKIYPLIPPKVYDVIKKIKL